MKKVLKQLPLLPILTSIAILAFSIAALSPPPNLLINTLDKKPDLLFEDVELNYYRSGKLTWRIKASHGSLDKKKLISQLENVAIFTTQQDKNQTPFALHSPKARYNLATQQILSETTHSTWHHNTLPIEFFTGPIKWDLTANKLYSQSKIKCFYNGYILQANTLFIDIEKKHVELSDNFRINSTYDN